MKKIIIMLILFSSMSLQAQIYRWVDEQGNVMYSDQPHPDAEQVELPPSATYTPPTDITERSEEVTQTLEPELNAVYDVRIMAPADDESIWVNNGNVQVTVSVEPALNVQQGDRLVISLNGNPVGEPQTGANFQLQNLSRGTHVLAAYVMSDSGEQISAMAQANFHLHRASALNNPASPPPANPSP